MPLRIPGGREEYDRFAIEADRLEEIRRQEELANSGLNFGVGVPRNPDDPPPQVEVGPMRPIQEETTKPPLEFGEGVPRNPYDPPPQHEIGPNISPEEYNRRIQNNPEDFARRYQTYLEALRNITGGTAPARFSPLEPAGTTPLLPSGLKSYQGQTPGRVAGAARQFTPFGEVLGEFSEPRAYGGPQQAMAQALRNI